MTHPTLPAPTAAQFAEIDRRIAEIDARNAVAVNMDHYLHLIARLGELRGIIRRATPASFNALVDEYQRTREELDRLDALIEWSDEADVEEAVLAEGVVQ